MYDSNYNDRQRCYITYEPLNQPELSLFNLVVGSSSSAGSDAQPFQKGIMEDFIDKNIVLTARRQGYLDYKYTLYGNKHSLPLSLKLEVKHDGTVMICEPPGNWGKLPEGFKSFYKDNMSKLYLTENVKNFDEFRFDEKTAVEVGMKSYHQSICVDVDRQVKAGSHVLTLVPQQEEKLMIAYLIVP